jgi:hypothetical protein
LQQHPRHHGSGGGHRHYAYFRPVPEALRVLWGGGMPQDVRSQGEPGRSADAAGNAAPLLAIADEVIE